MGASRIIFLVIIAIIALAVVPMIAGWATFSIINFCFDQDFEVTKIKCWLLGWFICLMKVELNIGGK